MRQPTVTTRQRTARQPFHGLSSRYWLARGLTAPSSCGFTVGGAGGDRAQEALRTEEYCRRGLPRRAPGGPPDMSLVGRLDYTVGGVTWLAPARRPGRRAGPPLISHVSTPLPTPTDSRARRTLIHHKRPVQRKNRRKWSALWGKLPLGPHCTPQERDIAPTSRDLKGRTARRHI